MVRNSVTTHPQYWTPEFTLNFLKEQKWADAAFVEAVRKHKLDGYGLSRLTKVDLAEMGIMEMGERIRILKEISTLAPEQSEAKMNLLAGLANEFTLEEVEDGIESFVASMRSPTSSVFDMTDMQLSPVNQVVSPGQPARQPPKKMDFTLSMRSGISSFRSNAADSVDGGSHTPFRGRGLRESMPDEGPDSPTLKEAQRLKAAASGGRNPSAPPRKPGSWKINSPVSKRKAAAPTNNEEPIEEAAVEEKLSLQEQQLRSVFKFMDVDQSGSLDKTELIKAMMWSCKWGEALATEVVEKIFDEVDFDKSGTISLNEFVKSKVASKSIDEISDTADKAKHIQRLTEVFNMIDADGSGEISMKELTQAISKMFTQLSEKARKEYCVAIIKEYDTDGDGLVNLEEFLNSKYAMKLVKAADRIDLAKRRQEKLRSVFQEFAPGGEMDGEALYKALDKCLPDYPTRSLKAYQSVIMSEVDKDKSGTINLEEFLDSEYANLIGGLSDEETGAAHNTSMDEDEDVMGRQDSNVRGAAYNTADAHVSSFGTVKRGDTPPPEESAWNQLEPQKKQQVANKSGGNLKTSAEEQERVLAVKKAQAQQLMLQGGAGMGVATGMLEKERRYSMLLGVFSQWDESSDGGSMEGSGFIEMNELKAVFSKFFCWSEDESEERCRRVMEENDQDGDGTLNFKEFLDFIMRLTRNVLPKQFDELCVFLKEAIGGVTGDAETERRNMLAKHLFEFWDFDESGTVEEAEVRDVIKRYMDMGKDSKDNSWVSFMMTSSDKNQDGKLDLGEFQLMISGLLNRLDSDDFDFVMYRLYRAVEHVQFIRKANYANVVHRKMMEAQLASTDIQQMLEKSSGRTPLIFYGITYDPARAVEKCANIQEVKLEPVIVSHEKSAKSALQEIKKKGFGKGWWIYMIIDKDYDSEWFLRELGIVLQTATPAHSFRLFMYINAETIRAFPSVLVTHAICLALDDVNPKHVSKEAKIVDRLELAPVLKA
uniref:Calmodulin n=1 Tax=Eutreptiella gymnastica TaxID=73025 RepID=A0A7S1NWU5_9EUGL|mmetsp:Transcript_96178/g.165829  ORF Transcript_96178/g.165829 Transcript_96178/m.165829 type:complete len:994 (+) Transcript_96178:54-3035(+)